MNLVWFRSDLRVIDNSALWNATNSGKTLACCLLPVKQWRGYGLGRRKIEFIKASAQELQTNLAKLNVPLKIIELDSFEQQIAEIKQLCQQQNIKHVFWNNEYPLDERRRDQCLTSDLQTLGIKCHRYDDALILPPGSVTTQQGEIYKVFTPFKKAWLSQVENQPIDLLYAQEAASPNDGPIDQTIKAGEQAGMDALKAFTVDAIEGYQDKRDIPDIKGTSELSAHLSAGTLSPRSCLKYAVEKNNSELSSGSTGISTWISQLIWREFYYHLIATQDSLSKHQPYKPETAKIIWNNDEDALQRWQQGNTGVPIVDAGMRQLNSTGWMHNRVRMITAMYLSKNLFLNWRLGEKYFLSQLVDADFALNNGGWQWSASTGTDSAPYFRVFNPFSQSSRFDPEGSYIKHFVPELRNLPAACLHDDDKLSRTKPDEYPAPMVNIKVSRLRAIEAFKSLST